MRVTDRKEGIGGIREEKKSEMKWMIPGRTNHDASLLIDERIIAEFEPETSKAVEMFGCGRGSTQGERK